MNAALWFLTGVGVGAAATLATAFGVLAWIWRIPRDL